MLRTWWLKKSESCILSRWSLRQCLFRTFKMVFWVFHLESKLALSSMRQKCSWPSLFTSLAFPLSISKFALQTEIYLCGIKFTFVASNMCSYLTSFLCKVTRSDLYFADISYRTRKENEKCSGLVLACLHSVACQGGRPVDRKVLAKMIIKDQFW